MSFENPNSNESRSPLKAAPLRYAGQSLDEEIQRVMEDEVLVYLLFAGLTILLALNEWWRAYMSTPPHPITFTLIAVVATAYATRRMMLARRRIRTLRLARDGERIVGQFLEELREKGYRVLHDVVGEGFNIDHLLIGPKGVFTVETKTISKPARGKPEIDYDGAQLLINGFKPDRDPVIQAKAQANWTRELIKELTGRSLSVRPTVVYPGWFVNLIPKGARHDVWVLNPKALSAFIDNSDGELGDEDVRSIHAHLSRYVRNSEQ